MNSNQLSREEIERYWGSVEIYNEEQRRGGLDILKADVFDTIRSILPEKVEIGKVEAVVNRKIRPALRQYVGLGLIKLGQWFAHHTNHHSV